MTSIKPGDIVRATYSNGISLFWEVSAVLLGGTHQEAVVELKPINQLDNAHGKTLCPYAFLAASNPGGSVRVYAS